MNKYKITVTFDTDLKVPKVTDFFNVYFYQYSQIIEKIPHNSCLFLLDLYRIYLSVTEGLE